jgi:hypothetical protein
LLFDFGWKFQLGRSTDPARDLGFGNAQDDHSPYRSKVSLNHVTCGALVITLTQGQAPALPAGHRGRNSPFEPVLRRRGW